MRYIFCVEIREVKGGKSYTVIKHIAHVHHILCVEIRNIE